MSQTRRIKKGQQQRLRDLETHLYFLWEARQLFANQEDRFKQIAAELRILVADHRPNRRLLLALMEEYDIVGVVHPPDPPFEKHPIPTVGWRDDPLHKKLTAEFEAAAGDAEAFERALQKQAALRCSMPLAEYVDKALAVMIEGKDYSYGQLVRAIAQQLGSSHEDTAVEESLVAMQQSHAGHLEAHLAPLIELCDRVIQVGTRFLAHVTEQHGYECRYFVGTGDPATPPPIDTRRAREIAADRPQEPIAGSSLQAKGTLALWLTHGHRDWVTNSHGYDFGTAGSGGVSLRAVKEPDGRLRLRFERQSGLAAVAEHPLEDTGRPAVHVVVTWQDDEVKFYVNGGLVQAVPLGDS